jgi:hypothetical protein
MAHTWKHDRAADHIQKKIDQVKSVTIVDYKRETSLESIPSNKAYKVDGVHTYIDIVNLDDMLAITETEGEMCHKRTLRFLNQHYRAVNRILARCETRRIDFHNQRLHALVTKPYGTDKEAARIHEAVAVAQLVIDVLAQTGDEDEHIPNAKVRVGIDSGVTLAVNNGRAGGREPLFLGNAANRAAKISCKSKKEGIYLSNLARKAIGIPEVDDEASTALTLSEIASSQGLAALAVTADEIVDDWRSDLKANPIGSFEFSRQTPPLKDLDISVLTPGNSRRQEAISYYADLDGFTKFVADNIESNSEDVVRVLHVIRSELDRVVHVDFEGRRIRFIGDCIHALSCEGTARTTDGEASVSDAVLCAGALRSSFDLAIEKLGEADIEVGKLGIQIGFEFGPMTVTRLGIRGDRVRCSVSRGVRQSEKEQGRCEAGETAIGPLAYECGTDAVKKVFGPRRKTDGLDYNVAVEILSDAEDSSASAAKAAAYVAAAPAVQRAAFAEVKPYAEGK